MKTEKQIRDMARYYYKKWEKEEDMFIRQVLINRIESFCMILECSMTELMQDDNTDLNSKRVPLDITRHEVIDLELAVLGVVFDAEDEMKNPSTTEGRKKVLTGTIKKWRTLHDKIKSQLEEFDKSYGF